ncbi:hypothetical protein ONS95_005297 [Cadophora gregata]|uniref:uncharacterized protein n=1 Tax=Cadophora gregata TaxID=51156 RepID=UPI0026DBA898|nr:uncharacterized protein ONS95_005297 [Cadophora gregata]KAK0103264.1 hypothetical protein ONS95_005297 [Cadophora gregata]KAK0107455.1 hypothetical protein ONS96_003270 [Cadophora gregata f. sp. sojae]
MDPGIVARLASISSLSSLKLWFPDRSSFPRSVSEEIFRYLMDLGNLTQLICSIPIWQGQKETQLLAQILANSPKLRDLALSPYAANFGQRDEHRDAIKSFFSNVCVHYAKIREISIQASETARLCDDWAIYRRLSIVPLLCLERLAVNGSTLTLSRDAAVDGHKNIEMPANINPQVEN